MSSETYGSSMLDSSAASWTWNASVFHVPQVSPVNASVDVWPDHGPAG